MAGRVEDDEVGNGSDSSIYSSDNDNNNENNNDRQQSKLNSLNPSWPQSYRLLSIFFFVSSWARKCERFLLDSDHFLNSMLVPNYVDGFRVVAVSTCN